MNLQEQLSGSVQKTAGKIANIREMRSLSKSTILVSL